MGHRSLQLPFLALIAASSCGCPMRPNPQWPGDGDADNAADGDADTDGDSDADVDWDVDADLECAEEQQLCGGRCVSRSDPSNCGECGRACSSDSACSCAGASPRCMFHLGHDCYAACPEDELLCSQACVEQPDEMSCGACGVHCDSRSDCECRSTEGGSAYECMRPDGADWVDC